MTSHISWGTNNSKTNIKQVCGCEKFNFVIATVSEFFELGFVYTFVGIFSKRAGDSNSCLVAWRSTVMRCDFGKSINVTLVADTIPHSYKQLI